MTRKGTTLSEEAGDMVACKPTLSTNGEPVSYQGPGTPVPPDHCPGLHPGLSRGVWAEPELFPEIGLRLTHALDLSKNKFPQEREEDGPGPRSGQSISCINH